MSILTTRFSNDLARRLDENSASELRLCQANAARGVIAELCAEPHYRAHLAARGERQLVMLGYSDSAKDGGLLASRWALQRTQVVLTELARESGIAIRYFHAQQA